jgi:hypothetical protein
VGTFVTDLSVMSNVALFEYAGGLYGLTVLKTDLGTFGLNVNSGNTVALGWATALEGMNVAAMVNYAVTNHGVEDVDESVMGGVNDFVSEVGQTIGLTLGAALQGDMPLELSLNFAIGGYENNYKNLDTDKSVISTDKNNQSNIDLGVAGRMGLGDGLLAVLDVNFGMNNTSTLNKVDATNVETSVVSEYSELDVNALIGKEIKASESMTIKMATGVKVGTESDSITTTKVTGFDTTYALTDAAFDLELSIPLNFAVSAKLNETWSINSGVIADIVVANSQDNGFLDDNESKTVTSATKTGNFNMIRNFDYAIGVTGKIGDLQLEINLDPMILVDGPYFLTGDNTNDLSLDLAIVYNWK